MPEEYEGQRVTAYHEAGHAIGAIRCPDGCIKYIDICNREENDEENGGTFATTRNADDAFRVYAGPWAQAKFLAPGESVDAAAAFEFLRGNRDDWIAFQGLVGNKVGVSEFTQMQESVLFGLPMLSEYREYRPPQEWHEKADSVLAAAWNEGEIDGASRAPPGPGGAKVAEMELAAITATSNAMMSPNGAVRSRNCSVALTTETECF